MVKLVDDFVRRHLAPPAHDARETKSTTERATDLRRNTKRESVALRNDDAFDFGAVLKANRNFSCAVDARRDFGDFDATYRERRVESRAGRLRKVGHLGERRRATPVNPLENLTRAKRRGFADGRQTGFERGQIETFDRSAIR